MSLSRGRRANEQINVEINIVPLVDVVLVLLIIFMVTATFVKASGMRLDLPEASLGQVAASETREIVIEVQATDNYVWEGTPVNAGQLLGALRDAFAAHGPETRVLVRGDRQASHGRVVQAMALAQEAGFRQLIVATQEPKGDGYRENRD